MVSNSIKWIEKEKYVNNIDSSEVEVMKLLWLNEINNYNNELTDVCWSLVFWWVGVLLNDSYKFYISLCEKEGIEPLFKKHYKFGKAIAE